MALLIDGYNLIHAAGIVSRGVGPGGLERSRLALMNFLVESLDEETLRQTTVVFDAGAAPPGLPSASTYRGLSVRFAKGYDSADSLIEELIGSDSAPRQLTVVSSDHRLQRAARRRKATAIDSDQWYGRVVQDRRQSQRAGDRRSESLKPLGPVSPDEVQYWLGQFSEVQDTPPKDAGPTELESIFPPGYAEDIEDENT